MPVSVSYPGVYVEELPSGVRTITGVSTSITAFVGQARRGPVNEPVTLSSFVDFERRFGGLHADFELGYAVRQFFSNGGLHAIVVRVAKNPTKANTTLVNDADDVVLMVESIEAGAGANAIEIQVDHEVEDEAGDPHPRAFNLTVLFDDPTGGSEESYPRLTMLEGDARYAPKIINGSSQLIVATPAANLASIDAANRRPREMRPDLERGRLTSGFINNHQQLNVLYNGATPKDQLRISLDGDEPELVKIELGLTQQEQDEFTSDTTPKYSIADKLGLIAERLQTVVRARKPFLAAYRNFTCTVVDGKQLVLESGFLGPGSSVLVSAADDNSIADDLELVDQTNAGFDLYSPSRQTLATGDATPFDASEAFGIYIANEVNREGVFALNSVELFNLLCLPGVSDPAILAEAAGYCARPQVRAFLVADSPPGTSIDDMEDVKRALPRSNHAAVYFPWVQVPDPLDNGKLRLCPPSGAVAGIYARTDSTRGVWKAPAGIEATLRGVQALEYVLDDPQNGRLNRLGVNVLRTFSAAGRVVWGARTLRGDDRLSDQYKYVPVRRLALFIEQSLYLGTQWVVFEPNDEPLWAQIRLNVGAFMHNLFRQGAFQGVTAREAYLVKCDRETTTQYDIDRGIVNILVGFAPLKPAEFVIIKIQQLTRETGG